MTDPFDAAVPISDGEIARRAHRRLVRLKAFYGHLAVYVAVNTMLHLINLTTAHRYWAIWPLLGWGLAIALQASATFDWPMRLLAPDWEDRKLRDFVDDERRKAGMAAARPPAPTRD